MKTTTNIAALPPIRLPAALYPALVEARGLRLRAASLETAGGCLTTISYLRNRALKLEADMFAAIAEQREEKRKKR